MNTKLLKLSRIGALVLGWLLVIGILANVWGIWGNYNVYLRAQQVPTGISNIVTGFKLGNALGSFFSNLGNAFLAFLIAAVFRMIANQAPVGSENARRLMIVCCLSYVANVLVQICSFISIVHSLIQLGFYRGIGPGFWFPFALAVIPAFVPLLYAATIFVLYTHFTKMVTFESEVA
jgi:hypothetical protein